MKPAPSAPAAMPQPVRLGEASQDRLIFAPDEQRAWRGPHPYSRPHGQVLPDNPLLMVLEVRLGRTSFQNLHRNRIRSTDRLSAAARVSQRRSPLLLLLAGLDLRRHDTDVVHVRRLGDVDHVGNGREVHVIVAPDEHDALGAVGVDLG
jgi:hypothetical protein